MFVSLFVCWLNHMNCCQTKVFQILTYNKQKSCFCVCVVVVVNEAIKSIPNK